MILCTISNVRNSMRQWDTFREVSRQLSQRCPGATLLGQSLEWCPVSPGDTYISFYMKALCYLERKGLGGVSTQQSTACEDVWRHSSEPRLHNFLNSEAVSSL